MDALEKCVIRKSYFLWSCDRMGKISACTWLDDDDDDAHGDGLRHTEFRIYFEHTRWLPHVVRCNKNVNAANALHLR